MGSKKIIYSLTIEDIQNVAFHELGRSLLPKEVDKIIELISEKINWYDAIVNSINEKIKP